MHSSVLVLITAVVAVQAANIVNQAVVYLAAGTGNVGGNAFGCANIRPAGAASQLGCVKHVFTDGFTVGVTDSKTKTLTLCSIQGTSGACGLNGVSVQVDLTGGTGLVPPPSGPQGTTSLSLAEQKNLPIPGNSATGAAATAPATSATVAPTTTPATGSTSCTNAAAAKQAVKPSPFVAQRRAVTFTG